MTRLLTAREVAAVLGVSPETSLRYWRVGKLPGFRLRSGQLRFRRRPCGCCQCQARPRLAGTEPLTLARELRFELTPTMRCSGKPQPNAIELPGTVTTEGVSTRWGYQLWRGDHDAAEPRSARAAATRPCRACYPEPGR